MRTRSLETLRREAATACKWRGHSMRWSTPFEKSSRGHAQQGDCRLCGAWVKVQDYCSANEIDIGGPAVAVDCNYKFNEVVVRYNRNTLRRGPNGYMAENRDGLTDYPVLRVDAYHCVWDHPEWFPARFRALVSSCMLKNEKEAK